MADRTNINTAAPSDEAKLAAYNAKLALYDNAVKAYASLSIEEKDNFNITLALNILNIFTQK